MPVVSVIVPVYNVEPYLHRCVDSILAQTFTDFELILVDDGSPDNCGSICDEYAQKDNRVKVIHKENGGVSAARNSGLDMAQGKYIAFCDSDDYWDADFLQTMVASIENTGADVVVSNFRTVDGNGTIVGESSHHTGIETTDSPNGKYHFMVEGILSGKYGWEIWSRIFRNDIIQQNHIRVCTTCGNYAEDLGFVLEYVLYAKSCYSIDYCGYNYFLRDGSMMRSSGSVVKLDQTNEVSANVGRAFYAAISDNSLRKKYPLIHFLIMRIEYMKLVGTQQYCTLPVEISRIKQNDWFRSQTKMIKGCYKEMAALYGKKVARQILLLSHFCLHGNWKRFTLESAVAYRWFIK